MTHNISYSDEWEFADWKGFQKVLFRLQRRIFKAVREDDKAKARRLQKLVLSSHAARMLAVRQVTQLKHWQENRRNRWQKVFNVQGTIPIRGNSKTKHKDLAASRITRNSHPKKGWH